MPPSPVPSSSRGAVMSRRPWLTLLGALILVPAVAANAASSDQSSTQENANPINDQGSSYHYRTYITSITPKVPGLSVEVLEFADRLLLRNNTGKTVTVYGYSGEPYIAGAARRRRRTERALAGGLSEHQLLRQCHRPAVGQRQRAGQVGRRRPDRPVRMARPSHPLDEPGHPASGEGHRQAHEDLRAGACRSR